jgi:hypothetical protein
MKINIIVSHSFLFRMRMFLTKVVGEIKAHTLYSITFLKNRAIYEIMWERTVEPGKPQMKIRHMRNALWIPKATVTQS